MFHPPGTPHVCKMCLINIHYITIYIIVFFSFIYMQEKLLIYIYSIYYIIVYIIILLAICYIYMCGNPVILLGGDIYS